MKAIENYLKVDKLLEIRLDILYDYLMNNDSNVDNIKIEIDKVDFQEESLKIIKTSEQGKVATIINNLIIEQIRNIVEMDNKVRLPIGEYFSNEELRNLLDDNKKTHQ